MKQFFIIVVFIFNISNAQNKIDFAELEDNIIKLNYEIEFYWQQEPFNDLNEFDTAALKNPEVLNLPRANWKQLKNTTPRGYGTFVYHLTLPDTINTYSLYTPRFTGGCKIWVNNTFQITHGFYSKDLEKSTSFAKPLLIKLPREEKITVTILTSNSDNFVSGGIDYFLAIGKEAILDNYLNKELAKDYVVFFLLLILTLYQLYLFYIYKDKRYLYLMLAFLTGCLRALCIQQHIIYRISPIPVPFYVVQKLRLMTVYMGCISMLLYYRELLPKQVHKYWFRFLTVIQIIGLGFYFFVSTYLATRIAVVMRLLFLVTMLYLVYLTIAANIKKVRYAKEIGLTTLFILVIAINGVFKSAIIINTAYVGVTALFLFLLAHMYINAKIQKDKNNTLFVLSTEIKNKKEENQDLKLESLRRIREKQRFKSSLKEMPDKTVEIKSILADMNKNNGEDEKSKILKTQIVADYQEFTKKLRTLHPTLTKTDLEIAIFIVLKKSRNEIADLRGVSSSSVKTSRSRLRKKLALSKEELLDDYLNSFL